ncbi:nucleoside monophosphate kinase, partial [bacterium]|nr:nucleoside monophosphate kinase [bacterium]
ELGKKAQSLMAEGKLVPDDLVGAIVREKVAEMQREGKGILFDGYPRNLQQAGFLDATLAEFGLQIDAAAVLEVPDEVLVKRVTGRRLCASPGCPGAFNIYFDPPKTEGKCDRCGSDLTQRKDDTEETLRERLSVYHSQTVPLLAYYEKKEVLIQVAGDGSVDDVRQVLLQGIGGRTEGSKA